MRWFVGLMLLLMLCGTELALAAPPQSPRGKRAKPPKFSPAVTDIFFENASEKLIGERPNYATSVAPTPGNVGKPTSSGEASPATAGGVFAWSKYIAPETLEDEIKSLQRQVSENVSTPAKFKGGGFKIGRWQYSELAVLFGIVAEHDAEVRWKQQAAGVRELMSRAGHNCKVGTDASYNEAKLRKEDLEQLVQGGSIKVPDSEATAKWEKVTDRPPLMQRLEMAEQMSLGPHTSNAGEFSKNAEKLAHEAQLVAAIAEVIQREGFEFSDDESYLTQARKMRDQAVGLFEAVKQKNYDAARSASSEIQKSCTACHEGFRS